MATTNLNIRTNKAMEAGQIFNELGLNMTIAVNMLLRKALSVSMVFRLEFLKLEAPNNTTAGKPAIEEGRNVNENIRSAPRYSSMDALKEALDGPEI